jgi:hypothetical protein
MRTLLRTLNAVSVTPRTTTFTLSPSRQRGMLLTTMISGERDAADGEQHHPPADDQVADVVGQRQR